MFFTQTFSVTLAIANPISFCRNKERNILIKIIECYEKKCYMGYYIVKIIKCENTSSCNIVTSNPSGSATMDVNFTAKVFILSARDVLIGVRLDLTTTLVAGTYTYKKDDDVLEISVIMIPTLTSSINFTTGQLIPVRIISTKYTPFHDKITAVAELLTCEKSAMCIKIVSDEAINKNSIEIKILLSNIKEELNKREKIKEKDKILYFESLLYSYQDSPKTFESITFKDYVWSGPKIIKKSGEYHNIFSLIENDASLKGLWTRPLHIHRSSPYMVKITDIKTINSDTIVESVPETLIIGYLKNILSFLIAIRNLTEVYNTDKLIDTYSFIWAHMRQAQQKS